jgi:ABC-type transport system involved in multi-copper enzyme maturation permease subunit
MPLPIDPGPLFKIELVAAARRWQTYALRAALVLALLSALFLVYINDWRRLTGQKLSINDYAEMGQSFAFTVLATQLTIILLAAPAATAGAICLDKSRGNMTLLMASTLSSAEIVLGKLAARMFPVFGLIAASVPVLFIATLLGGISGEYLVGGFIVIVGAAVFTAAVAFLFSVWVGRTHEALLLTYFVVFAWLLGYPIIDAVFGWRGPAKTWLMMQNPFVLMFAPMQRGSGASWNDYFGYAVTTLVLAVTLIGVAIWRVRDAVLSEASRGVRRKKAWLFRRKRSVRLLDRAPLRWYERHRKRPSLAGRTVNLLFVGCAIFCSVWAAYHILGTGGISEFAIFVNMFQVGIGLLLTTVYAVTSLADERARGSLDILLTTPVKTRAIVLAKWRSAFAHVPWLVVLPLFVGVVQACFGSVRFGIGGPDHPWMRPALLVTLVVLPIAAGAFVTSIGLYFATRIQTFGRAVGVAIAFYVFMAIAWPMMAINSGPDPAMAIVVGSPGLGAGLITAWLQISDERHRSLAIFGGAYWTLVYVILAVIFYLLTLRNFNRCMGRISERPARPARPKRKTRRGLGVEWVEPRGMP